MALQVIWLEELDTQFIIRDILPNSDDDEVRDFSKKIGLIWEVFEVHYENYSWKVIKNHNQIQDFILAYNLRFKSKLTFQLFRQEGVNTVCANSQALIWLPLHEFFQTKDRELSKIGSFKLLKKSGGRFKDFCCRLPWQWSQRSFVVTRAGVMYYTQPSKEIKEYIPFSCRLFRIYAGKKDTDHDRGIRLQANHRKLLLYADNWSIFFKFVYCIKETLKKIEGPESHPFQSFAPVRKLQNIQFLVDGQEYFKAVCEALEKSEWQIMICGWWISPEFQLVRPVNQYPEKRLDTVLEKATHRGVKVFILVYNESSFLTNDSAYTKQIFEAISPNIKVLQHPLGVLPTFWSHHQKVVIVDQAEVILGGMDLCYGRFDTSEHLIWQTNQQWYPGIQYNNIRTKDFTKVRQFWNCTISRSQPRLPWHDVGVKFMGEVVADVCHHFIQYWNYASFQTHYEDRYVLILDHERSNKIPIMKRIKEGINSKLESLKNFAGGLKEKLFKKDNTLKEEEKKESQVREEEIKVEVEQEIIGSQTDNHSHKHMIKEHPNNSDDRMIELSRASQANKKSEEFRKKMLAYQTETTENQFNNNSQPPIKKSIIELDEMVEEMSDNNEQINYINDVRVVQRNKMAEIREEEDFSCQILRSVGGWSIGCNPILKEDSIYKAYLSLIEQAENFIYIQNQFFISAVEGSFAVKNQLANALFNRIVHAHDKQQQFKVIMVLPLIPGFAGQLDDPEAVIPRVIMHWQYQTIIRNQNSLVQRLKTRGIDPDQYLSFFSLRTHGITKDEPFRVQTQIIYLHSKLMIIDDRRLIIGSANLNDRSMRGSRDSELCLFVEGQSLVRVTMGQRIDDINEKIRDFRLKLWKQHFGEGIPFENPLDDDECLRQIRKRALNNTAIYRTVFNCYPDDYIPTFKVLAQWRERSIDHSLYSKIKREIKGTVVEFPLQFLKDQNLLVGSTLYPDSLSV